MIVTKIQRVVRIIDAFNSAPDDLMRCLTLFFTIIFLTINTPRNISDRDIINIISVMSIVLSLANVSSKSMGTLVTWHRSCVTPADNSRQSR